MEVNKNDPQRPLHLDPAPAWMQGADLIADLSTDTEDVILAFTVDTYDAGEINPSFSVKIGEDWYDTMNTID